MGINARVTFITPLLRKSARGTHIRPPIPYIVWSFSAPLVVEPGNFWIGKLMKFCFSHRVLKKAGLSYNVRYRIPKNLKIPSPTNVTWIDLKFDLFCVLIYIKCLFNEPLSVETFNRLFYSPKLWKKRRDSY